jgi:CheY-like chemotaxis protein
MLVRCPQCKKEFRLVDFKPDERVVKYLCPGCGEIVGIDLEQDAIQSSSAAGHFSSFERPKTVLVADDTRTTRTMAKLLLGAAGFNVLLAADGGEALTLIRERHPDLVVLDLLMPTMTGFDVLREVFTDERLKSTPVIAMSSVYKDNVVEFLQQLGVSGFLDKHHFAETLVFRVRQILEPEAES